jgi:hypothetical protein
MAPRGLPRDTSYVVSTEVQGWYEDPFQLHEARYFSAGRPTKLARDGDAESYDEPPGEGVPGSGTAASEGHAVSGTLNRAEAGGPDPLGGDGPAYARRRPRVGVLMAVGVVVTAGAVTAAVDGSRRSAGIGHLITDELLDCDQVAQRGTRIHADLRRVLLRQPRIHRNQRNSCDSVWVYAELMRSYDDRVAESPDLDRSEAEHAR